MSEVTGTYSKLATALGLMSCLLVDGQQEQSKGHKTNMFKCLIECLTKPAPIDTVLVENITEEYLSLQVTIWPLKFVTKDVEINIGKLMY